MCVSLHGTSCISPQLARRCLFGSQCNLYLLKAKQNRISRRLKSRLLTPRHLPTLKRSGKSLWICGSETSVHSALCKLKVKVYAQFPLIFGARSQQSGNDKMMRYSSGRQRIETPQPLPTCFWVKSDDVPNLEIYPGKECHRTSTPYVTSQQSLDGI